MNSKKSRTDIVKFLIDSSDLKGEDEEELLHILLQHKVSKNIDSANDKDATFGDKMADNIARFAGSWVFILSFTGCLLLWILINVILLTKPFDPYPFILLNLMLSCVAALQAPVIMMSQNRQETKDRQRSQNDYKVNLKSEIIIEDLHEKIDTLLENQEKLLKKVSLLESMQNKK